MILPDLSAFTHAYFQAYRTAVDGISVTDEGGEIPYSKALAQAFDWLQKLEAGRGRLFIVGNGGSAGIASHLAVDFWKNGRISALTFNDGALLTCLSNDLAFEEAFAAGIRQFAHPQDLAICISSSGNSENIFRAVNAAHRAGARVITCTGFDPGNRIRPLGEINFFVPSFSYGIVETAHQFIIHSLLDAKLHLADGMDVFDRNRPKAGS